MDHDNQLQLLLHCVWTAPVVFCLRLQVGVALSVWQVLMCGSHEPGMQLGCTAIKRLSEPESRLLASWMAQRKASFCRLNWGEVQLTRFLGVEFVVAVRNRFGEPRAKVTKSTSKIGM
jgi:hypothetical protein